jgi:hypothetical protein
MKRFFLEEVKPIGDAKSDIGQHVPALPLLQIYKFPPNNKDVYFVEGVRYSAFL